MDEKIIEELIEEFENCSDDDVFKEVMFYVSEEFSLDLIDLCEDCDRYELVCFMRYDRYPECEECIEHIFG